MLQEGRAAVEAYAEAQVRPILCAGSSTVLRVVLTAVPPARDAAHGPEPAPRRLSLAVQTRGLKVALGGRRTRELRLTPGGTAQATFRLVGVDRGPGEVAVVIRGDHETPLATLQLTVEVVASDDHDQTGVARVTAPIPARPIPSPPATAPGITAAGLGSTA